MIHDAGFEKYYELRDKSIAPVNQAATRERDLSWLKVRADNAEKEALATESNSAELTLDLQGISCVGCVWLVEKLFEEQAGCLKIHVQAQLGRITMRWQPQQFDVVAFAQEIQQYGYLVAPPGQRKAESSQLVSRIGLCGAFGLNAMLFTLPRYLGMSEDFAFADLFNLLTLLCATLSMAVGSTYFIDRAWRGLKARVIHIDTPISLGVIAAYIGSVYGWLSDHEPLMYFDFVSIFIFLMLVGRWTQEVAVEKNRNRIVALDPRETPLTFYNNANDDEPARTDATPSDLTPGQFYRVLRGQTVPVCSRLYQGDATVSLECINGESEPRHWHEGRLLPSGAVNIGNTELRLEATEGWGDAMLSRLLQSNKEQEQRNQKLEQVLKWYISLVILIACGGFAYWFAIGESITALQVMVSVLVVSCPCALGVAWPLTNELAVGKLRKAGVFVRELTLWERLREIRTIVFDKTGTLTLETPRLTNPETLDSLNEESLAALATLVNENLHPVGRALRDALLNKTRTPPLAKAQARPTEIPGMGLSIKTDTGHWSLGRPGWRGDKQHDTPSDDTSGYDAEFCHDGKVMAAFRFEEHVREGAQAYLSDLRKRGYRLTLLSGDRKEKVSAMGSALGFKSEELAGGLTPEQKAEWLKTHAPNTGMMIGDGVNDALAFDTALVSGTPVVDTSLLEARADFFFTGQSLNAIPDLLDTAHRRTQALRAVFIFSVLYNVATISASLYGAMNPLLAAILMPLSSLATIAIAIRKMR